MTEAEQIDHSDSALQALGLADPDLVQFWANHSEDSFFRAACREA